MKLSWRTHPRIVRAQQEVWQSEKQLWFFDQIVRLIKLANAYVLERQKIGRILTILGKAMEKGL